ncbi:Hypothetical protein AA314_09857 [Archangium gephyra]|uniref:Uncharacterized protein n=1 Tax=Archangium gephyra TaxID=48 RepID=A0AAC8QIL8_9BACT|nr:Hypothetical protein AA314_09857 [Archangium gephyra]
MHSSPSLRMPVSEQTRMGSSFEVMVWVRQTNPSLHCRSVTHRLSVQ